MHPEIHINYLAVVAAVIVSFFFGWLWYGPLFGKKWASLMKMPTDCKTNPKITLRGMNASTQASSFRMKMPKSGSKPGGRIKMIKEHMDHSAT